MERVPLLMDKATRKWLRDFAKANYWRVASWYELEDLLQDGMVLWHQIRQRYRGRQGKHLTNTFKLSFRNHVHDLATARTKAVPQFLILDAHDTVEDDDHVTPLERLSPREPESQTFAADLRSAPYRVQEALAVFASDVGRAALRRPYRLRGDGSRETLNERLCRIAGFDSNRVDLVGHLRAYLATD